MNIKQRLKIVVVFIVLVLVVFSTFVYIFLQRYQGEIKKEGVAHQIALSILERRLLAQDYILNPGERSKSQWYIEQDRLNKVVADNVGVFKSEDEKELISNIQAKLQDSENLFEQTVALQENVASPSAATQEKENRLVSQLTVKAQETISDTSRLASIEEQQAQHALQRVILLLVGAVSLFLFMLLISFWVIGKSAKELEQSNERFVFVSKATNDAIYDWDIKTNAIWFGDGMYKLFGYSKNQIQETLDWWSGQIHPDDRDRINKELDEVLKGDKNSFSLEYRFKKADGNYAEIIDRALLVRDDNRKPIRYIGVMQDVTSTKNYEAELKQRTDEAERLNRIAVNRELRMIELKREIQQLKTHE